MTTDRRSTATKSRPDPAQAPDGGRRLGAVARVRPRAPRSVLLVLVVASLSLLGLMMVLSASSVEALRSYGGNAWLFFQRQVTWLMLGMVALAVTSRVDYRVWRRLAGPLLVVSVVLLTLVLIPALGDEAGGSRRWLGFGTARFQPSELAKLALLLFAADLLARRGDRVTDSRAVLRPLLLVLAVLAALVLLEPDMGTAMLIVLIGLTILFVGGAPLGRLSGLFLVTGGLALVVGMAEPYRRARILAFLNPWKDPGNTGYQVTQSLVALGSGHLTGVGLGASRAKWGFLPNAHTDFIFAIIGEELGLVGTLLVVALFAAFAVLGVGTAMRAPDRYGMLVAAGVTAWVVGQALVNMGAVTGRLPVTGVPLPFLSFGGSSLVVTMAAAGMLVSIARHGARPSGAADAGGDRVPAGGGAAAGGGRPSGRTLRSGHAGEGRPSGRTLRSGQPLRSGHAGPAGQPLRSGPAGQPLRSGHAGQAGHAGPAGQASQRAVRPPGGGGRRGPPGGGLGGGGAGRRGNGASGGGRRSGGRP